MGADNVHQRIQRFFGIILHQREHPPVQFFGAGPLHKKGNNLVFEGIIHHAVQFPAQQIAAQFSIGYLVGSVLPDLADDDGIRVGLFYIFPQ